MYIHIYTRAHAHMETQIHIHAENSSRFIFFSLFLFSFDVAKKIIASSNRSITVPANSVSLRDMNQSRGSVEKEMRETRIMNRCGR